MTLENKVDQYDKKAVTGQEIHGLHESRAWDEVKIALDQNTELFSDTDRRIQLVDRATRAYVRITALWKECPTLRRVVEKKRRGIALSGFVENYPKRVAVNSQLTIGERYSSMGEYIYGNSGISVVNRVQSREGEITDYIELSPQIIEEMWDIRKENPISGKAVQVLSRLTLPQVVSRISSYLSS